MSDHQRIFLGHASEDKPQVRKLYDQLKSHGFSPWLDAVDLIPGQIWRDGIPNAIKSAGIFLACLSKRSVEKPSYVQREFRYALSAYAERPPNSIYLIPVRLDECEIPDLRLPKLDLNLRDFHWVDLFEKDGFELLLQALKAALGSAQTIPTIYGGDDRLSLVKASFEALFAASEKGTAGNNPAAHRIRDNLADCLDDLHCCGRDFEILATFPSHLAGLVQDIEEHLLGHHFEAMPAGEVLRKLEALTAVAGDASRHRVDTLNREDLVAALKAAIGQALNELPSAGLEHNVIKLADRELRHLRREVGKLSFDVAVVSERRKRLENLTVNLLERTTLLTEALLAEGFPNLPTGTVFRDMPKLWCPQMVMIPAGVFLMGSPSGEKRRNDDEGPQHEVIFAKAFALGRFPVTEDEYVQIVEERSSSTPDKDGDRMPITNLYWHQARAFCEALSKRLEQPYCLPSEAMWEYACRAGTTTAFYYGERADENLMNFSDRRTPVDRYPPNPWGLYDMHANILQWCEDDWHENYQGAPIDGSPWRDSTARDRVQRGGSWHYDAPNARAALRNRFDPEQRNDEFGFRCARVQRS